MQQLNTSNAFSSYSISGGGGTAMSILTSSSVAMGSHYAQIGLLTLSGVSAGTTTFTCSSNETVVDFDCEIQEIGAAVSVDASASATGTSTSLNSGSITTNYPNEYLWGIFTQNLAGSSMYPQAGWYERAASNGGELWQDVVTGASGTYSAAMATSNSGGWIAAIVGLRVAVPSGTAAFIQAVSCGTTTASASLTCTFPTNVGAGDELFAWGNTSSSCCSVGWAVSDSLNGSWIVPTPYVNAYNQESGLAYFENTGGGADAVVLAPASSQNIDVVLLEYAGMAKSNSLDISPSTTTSTGQNGTTPTITTFNANDLILAGLGCSGNMGGDVSVSSPFTIRWAQQFTSPLAAFHNPIADQIVSTVGNVAGATFLTPTGCPKNQMTAAFRISTSP